MSVLAVDDGIAAGNLNAADIFFIIGAILGLIAAVLMHPRPATAQPWPISGLQLLSLAVGCAAFGLFLL